ncbi:MAG: SRPBCC domain-containing protein [Chlorobia bacterium]|nr:SRPBCC domain-containing protein [Fimbriimonadaceae bacterium]
MNATPTAECSITLTRVFDAPLSLVWKAWTSAEHVAAWWGPREFTNPICEWETRPGGKIRIHMMSPEGAIYPMGEEFVEVVPMQRLVFTSTVDDADGSPVLRGRSTVLFADSGGKTHLTLESGASGFVDYASQMLAGMEAGWSQSLEKLGELVGGLT